MPQSPSRPSSTPTSSTSTLFSETETYREAQKARFKYPAEDEHLVRRLGSALLACWGILSPEQRERIFAEALTVWDREYHVPALEKKLEAFLRRAPARTR